MNSGGRILFLTGPMGSGKSTVGRILAGDGQWFCDLDGVIEEREGRSVGDIFARDGEAVFRTIERDTLAHVLRERTGSGVVALGGGTLLDEANRQLVEESGAVIALLATPQELAQRVRSDATVRPLLAAASESAEDALAKLIADRSDAYGVYPQVETTGISPEQVAEAIRTRNPQPPSYEVRLTGQRPTGIQFATAGTPDWVDVAPFASSLVIITDRTTRSLHGDRLIQALGAAERVVVVEVEDGEQSKSMATATMLFERLARERVDRSSVVVALGGGVVCDLAGFVASTYMRGVDLVSIPTTLLAQVDAAIGGKTGVDLGPRKNVVGTFFAPRQIVIDASYLATLGDEHLRQGLAEIVKIGFVRDAALVGRLESLQQPAEIRERSDIIRGAIRNKVAVVNQDPTERSGLRALLNFGHTIGHAIEGINQYTISHGECVSIGMAMEARAARHLGYVEAPVVERLERLLTNLGLPTTPPETRLDNLIAAMHHDKKASGGVIRMVMLRETGMATLEPVAESDLRDCLSTEPGVTP